MQLLPSRKTAPNIFKLCAPTLGYPAQWGNIQITSSSETSILYLYELHFVYEWAFAKCFVITIKTTEFLVSGDIPKASSFDVANTFLSWH